MPDYLIIIFRILATVLGFTLLGAGLFLYEKQEGTIQSKLEDWWVRIDDLQKQAFSKHAAFMRVIAEKITKGFDRAFGKQLFSLQSLTASVGYARASISLATWLLSIIMVEETDMFLLYFLMYLFLATIPIFIKDNESWLMSWLMLFWILIFLFDMAPFFNLLNANYSTEFVNARAYSFYWGLSYLLGITLYFIIVIYVRKNFRQVSISGSFPTIIKYFLYNTLPIGILFIVTYLIWIIVSENYDLSFITKNEILTTPRIDLPLFLVCVISIVGLMNSIFIIATIFCVVLASLLALHRIFWPIIQRPLYALQRLGIAKRAKFFGVLGILLIVIGFGKVEWLGNIWKIFDTSR